MQNDLQIHEHLRGNNLVFASTWGLFSPDAIDEGSALLLEVIDVPHGAHILDLGCGYGVLGIALAKADSTNTVTMVDKDFVAVEYTNRNIQANTLTNAKALLSNGFSHIPSDQRFDCIVANLPAKVGNELLETFFHDAHTSLNPQGRFVVVTIAGLKDYVKRQCRDIFGNHEKLKQRGTYVVAQAEKKES